MGNFNFSVPALANKFVDYRNPILGNSYTWNWERPLSQPTYIAIHHTAGPDTQTPDDIAAYHVQTKGWGGVGYHFIIAKNGTTYYVGDLTTARAHVYGQNHLAIGVCLIGTFMNGRVPSDQQLQSAHELSAQILFRTPAMTNLNGWEDVAPHKQFRATACPGDTWDSWRQKILTGLGSGNSNRAQEVTKLYQVVLGRDPDQSGLNHYVSGNLSINDIRRVFTESEEHQNLINTAHNFNRAKSLASESLQPLSETYWKIDAITKLGS